MMTNLARPFADGYGYQWWLDKSGRYSAIGVGGQFIMVVPKENLVVVFTSKLAGAESFLPVKLLTKFILPAVISDEPLPGDDFSQAILDSLSMARPDSVAESIEAIPWRSGTNGRPSSSAKNHWRLSTRAHRRFHEDSIRRPRRKFRGDPIPAWALA